MTYNSTNVSVQLDKTLISVNGRYHLPIVCMCVAPSIGPHLVMDWLNSLSPILLNGECIELQHNGVPYEGGEATPLYVIKCGWYTGGTWDTLVVRGCLGKAIANICIPLAIPSSMDVKHMVSFEIDSSEVLFDCSNGLIISSWWDLLWLP